MSSKPTHYHPKDVADIAATVYAGLAGAQDVPRISPGGDHGAPLAVSIAVAILDAAHEHPRTLPS